MNKTFSSKNSNGMVINYEEFETHDTSLDIVTKSIMSRKASFIIKNMLELYLE
jgi:hypothetical protein